MNRSVSRGRSSPPSSTHRGPTTAMPELGLSDAERDAVVAFLLSG